MSYLDQITVGSTTYDIQDSTAAASLAVDGSTLSLKDRNDSTLSSVTLPSGLPTGGTTGQILRKSSNTSGDVNWSDDVYIGTTAPSDSNVVLWYDESAPANSIVTSVNGQTGAVTVFTGSYVTGTSLTNSVPTATSVNLMSIELTAGIWIITGGHEFTASFTQTVVTRFALSNKSIAGSIVRSTGDGGGGINIALIYQATSDTTVYLTTYQSSGSTQTAQNVVLRAYKLSDI